MDQHAISSTNRKFRRPTVSASWPVLFVVLAFACPPLWADAADDAAKFNASGSSAGDVSWLSGGVGDEARDEMRRAASAYNVHLLFSTTSGAYLAAVPFSVARNDGQEVYSGVSDGPMLYLKLKPGTYKISAEIDGGTQTRVVRVGGGPPTKLSFVSRSQVTR